MDVPATYRSMTFADAIRAAAGRDPGKAAIVMVGREVSFGDLADRVGRLRDAAIGLGVAKGDVVAIASRNRPEFIEVVAGVPDAGAAVATVNPGLAPAEVAQTLEDCGAQVVFVDAESRELVEASGVAGLTIIEFGPRYEALLAAAAPAALPRIDEWDAWTILHLGHHR